MSFFWSSWITVFSLSCWVFIATVLVWTVRTKPVLEEDETTGHSYDGIKEYDKPLPKWWLVVFYATLAWALVYMALYTSIQPANLKGLVTVTVDGQEVPWSSRNELYSQLQENNAVFRENFDLILEDINASGAIPILDELSQMQAANKLPDADPELQSKIDEKVQTLAPFVDKMSEDPQVQKMGNSLFQQNCAVCHGSDAKGGVGYPNLTDNDWLYGGASENILLTIHNGRVGGMAAWREKIGESGIRAAAEYVLDLSGNQNNYQLDRTMVAQGEAIFKQNCVLCHGPDGKGMHTMGAPNLTDDIWLYGGDRDTIRETIRHGRAGVMPAWQSRLGNERIMLLAAYVKSLSQTQE